MKSSSWPMPEQTTRSDGEPRHVGIEFELQGLAVETLARVVAKVLDGSLRTVSAVEYEIDTQGVGSYRVEVDYDLLKVMARRQAEENEDAPNAEFDSLMVDLLKAASSVLVPCEVVSPPIAMTELPRPMAALVQAIRAAGGQGTRHSPLYAFGLHLNVEPPHLDAKTVAAYIKAFVCLYEYIVVHSTVDMMRRVTPFIDPFPTVYEDRLLDPDYWPDWHGLITDYLHYNPTRNRGLDMLPLFAHHDAALVKATVDDGLIKARPAFHYRLANCEIDDPGWSIESPWRYWLQIEHLVEHPDKLEQCCLALKRDHEARLLRRIGSEAWQQTVTQWLRDF